LFLRKPLSDLDLEHLRNVMAWRWHETVAAVSKSMGIDIGLPDIQHGCHVDYGNSAAEYLTKMGFDLELTDSGEKAGRGQSRTMFQVAQDLVVRLRMGLTARAATDEKVWRGYVEGMKGFKPFWLAAGLVGKVNALPVTDGVPPELAHTAGEVDEPADAELVYRFPSDEWLRLRRAGPIARAEVMRIVEDGGGGPEVCEYVASLPWSLGHIYRNEVWGADAAHAGLDSRAGEDAYGRKTLGAAPGSTPGGPVLPRPTLLRH
jgi:hypothetical protein